MATQQSLTRGIHHAGLTVPDLDEARDFFTAVLGFEQVGERPDYPAVFVSDGTVMITLWQVRDASTAAAFDHKQVIGLHHLALQVSADTLDALYVQLCERGDVVIEFAPESLGQGPTRHMMFTMPGGIRLELIAPSG